MKDKVKMSLDLFFKNMRFTHSSFAGSASVLASRVGVSRREERGYGG